jgi:hypothetical protein
MCENKAIRLCEARLLYNNNKGVTFEDAKWETSNSKKKCEGCYEHCSFPLKGWGFKHNKGTFNQADD